MLKIFFYILPFILSFSLFAQESQVENLDTTKTEHRDSSNTSIGRSIFAGILLHNKQKQQSLYISPLIDLFQFNTIEGFTTQLSGSYTKHLKSHRFYALKPKFRYGFGNQSFHSQVSFEHYYDPSRFASIEVSGGKFVEQLNSSNPISALNNTYYTLLFDRNFLKIYDNTFFEVSHTFSPIKDFLLTTDVNWAERSPLQNLSRYTVGNSTFTSNDPRNNELNSTAFATHKSLIFRTEISWQYKYKSIRSRGKFKSVSNHPKLTLTYVTGVPSILGSNLSYQKLAFQVEHIFKFKSIGSSQFHSEIGGFVSMDNLSFIDFKHFNGNRTLYDEFEISKFQLLDYFQYSTSRFYLESHYQHHFNGSILRKISFLKKTKIQSVISINHLYSQTNKNYWEFGMGIEKIFNKIRFDYYISLKEGVFQNNSIRFGILF